MSDYIPGPTTEDRDGMTVHLNLIQGSPEWHKLRAGRVTCSALHRVITPKTQEYAGGAKGYIAELLAEEMLGEPLDWGDTAWTGRGTELEADAISWYALERGVEVERVGCIERDGLLGSPDALIVGQKAGAEIKVPGAQKHMENLLGLEDIAKATQVQGLIRIVEADWWDVVSYNPKLPKRINRVYRDEKFQAALTVCLAKFSEELEKARERLKAAGDVIEDDGLLAQLAASVAKKKKGAPTDDAEALVDKLYGPPVVLP